MKQAAVKSARLQLDYCTIRAPIDGTVINRTVNVGQPVAASLQAPNLFSIGQDLTHMIVYTNTDEADVGRIRVGAQATFRVDTFPRETFSGQVAQVRMNAATIQNVVTYNTTISFDNPDVRLFPGMTAYVSIPVAWVNNVVKIPNGALRFKPDLTDSERSRLYAKYGITDNARGTTAGRIAASGSPAAADSSTGTAAGNATGAGGRAGGSGSGGSGGQNGGRGGGTKSQREDTGIVWKLLPDKTLEPVQVGLGVTDFTFTAMTKGTLKPSDDLVIGQSTTKTTAAKQNQTSSPIGGSPGMPRRF
jgi:HlyD family secretion protein